MTTLPSYQEATSPRDWLQLAAPHVRFADYRALCLVNRRFWAVFAPRLWADLFRAARLLGLHPGDDLSWWLDFVFERLSSVAPATRALVHVLDAREFAKDAYHFASDQAERTLEQSFKRALALLANVQSILLDGHPDIDPCFLSSLPQRRLRLLSMSHCPVQLPNNFFHSPSLQGLVYLDISAVPGSIWPLIRPSLLPHLRILKVRDREIDDATLGALANLFRLRLWSLDLSGNKITDRVIQTLRNRCFPFTVLRSDAHFQVEGSLTPRQYGTTHHGPFVFVQESPWSGSFSHPERYLVDAPMYTPLPSTGHQEYQAFRPDGRSPTRRDSADAVVRLLVSRDDTILATEHDRNSGGLTHLQLSNNQVSAFGIDKLLRISNGQLENFACDSMPLLPPASAYATFWPKSARLYGILGMGHVFRPVVSPHLRVLKIHHSLVTHIPALEMDGLSTLARTYVSEMSILPRVDQAYPLAFVPDTNPRLTSLTLTCIPRRSSGPLITRLIEFLRQVSIQERAAQDASTMASSWRGPDSLLGLRHLRLEFECDPMDASLSVGGDLNAEELMNSGEPGFSFFDDDRVSRSSPEAKSMRDAKVAQNSSASNSDKHESGRDNNEEFVTYRDEWNGEGFSIPVWTGAKTASSNTVIDEYRRLVHDHRLRDGVGPITPSQLRAGAPERSYIFHTAWCIAVMPQELKAPTSTDLAGMQDVVSALRTYRLSGRDKYSQLQREAGRGHVPPGEPHFFWGGRLEVSTETAMPRARPPQNWR